MNSLPNVDVGMIHMDLTSIPVFPLPTGYQIRSYKAGDLAVWLAIQATDPFFWPTAEDFRSSFSEDPAELHSRLLFLVDQSGNDIGTIAAWHNQQTLDHEIGQIHWVEMIPAARGLGLGKSLVSAALQRMREFGYHEAYLETNTRRIPAINLYLQMGFRPYIRSSTEQQAWHIIAPHLRVAI